MLESKDQLHLVTELCTGGNLLDFITAKTEGKNEGQVPISEHDAAEIIKQIIRAVHCCHETKNIYHGDLKPKILMFESPEHSVIKIDNLEVAHSYPESSGGTQKDVQLITFHLRVYM